MRITPLSIFCCKLKNDEDIINVARNEMKLIHGNEIIQHVGASWVLA